VLVTCQSWLLTTQIAVEETLFSQKLWMALDRTRYMQSSKTFVMVDRPFWNDLRADGWPLMGMTLTDRLTRGTYLFDNGPDKPGVICLSYAWMSDALKMLPHGTEKRVTLALSALQKIYPDVDIASHVIGDPISISWEADPHFLGAFKGALPGHYRYNHRMYGHFMQDGLPAAERGIFIEGRGLDAEMSLDAHVGGTSTRPILSGTARIVRGEYDFAGKRFEFDPRGAVYLASSPERIRLDLTATRDDPSLTAVIRVRGTAAKPEITLTSSPVLPNDEVLSRILFGASASQLSPLEAAQLASALAALAGGGGFDVIGNLKNFAGLDRLVFTGGGAAGAMTIAGGKYVTDDVYLEIIGGGREGPAAQVEWRVRRNLSIISRLQGEGGGKLSMRWRRDY